MDIEAELNNRISCSASCLGTLRKQVWKRSLETKIAVYSGCVLSTLLYGSEAWSIYAEQITRLNKFHLRNSRRILGVSWRNRVSNEEVLRRCGCDSMTTILTSRRLRSFGHVCRLPDTRLPKAALFSETASESRPSGWPILRFQDRVRDVLPHCGILVNGVERACAERNGQRKLVHNGAIKAESTGGKKVNQFLLTLIVFQFSSFCLEF